MRVFLIIALLSSFLIGCSENDDNITLDGEWSLLRVNGGLAGVDLELNPGQVIWSFDTNDGMVTIADETATGFSPLESGTYKFRFGQNSNATTLIVDDNDLGVLSLQEDRFSIDQRFVDGFLYEFTRDLPGQANQ